MAAAVPQKIKRDPLSCYICSGALKEPIGLPCLHTFCYECLCTWHQSSQDKTHVICPECKTPTTVPKSGIQGFPAYSMAEDLKDAVYMGKKLPDSTDTVCYLCGKKADSHCIDCTKSICQLCQSSHDAFTEDHEIISIQDLASGQVSTEGRVCKVHGVKVRYYCNTEEKQVCIDCVGLNTCPPEHKRLALKEAATNHVSKIDTLRKEKCIGNKRKFQDAIKETDSTISDLSESLKRAKSNLANWKQGCIYQLEQVFDEKIREMEKVQKGRVKQMEDKKKVFEAEVSSLEKVDTQALKLTAGNSDYFITHKFPMISKALNALNLEKLDLVDRSMGYLHYESIPISVPHQGYVMKRERWELIDQFSLNGLEKPQAIAINQDGDIIVTSYVKGVKVFSRTGQVKRSFMEVRCQITGVVVSYDNRYILTGGVKYQDIEFYSREGKHLSSVPVCNTKIKETVDTIAIDARNQIIAGLSTNTISIHYADGSLVSKFATKSTPFRLAVSFEGEIVCSVLDDKSCLLMDYSGSNVRVVQPPSEVKKWAPENMCCREGEIFVVNGESGDPTGIFRYTAKGHYLGCVTTEVKNPRGIALSQDGMELFVVEHVDQQLKIFHRE